MKVIIGEYNIDINAEKNENYYRNERYISEGCKCDGCQNYELAIQMEILAYLPWVLEKQNTYQH